MMHQKDFSRPNSIDSSKTSFAVEFPGANRLLVHDQIALLALTLGNRKSINCMECHLW
jgi:hypothetical protein